jgi:hypothetical protein
MAEDTALDSSAPEEAATSQTSSDADTQEPSTNLGEGAAKNGGSPDRATPNNGQAPKEHLSRYERTKRERAAFKAQQAEFQRQREAFAKERAQFEEQKKPKRDYTLADLRKYRGQWEAEGNYDLVEKADKEIAVLEAEEQAERAARTVEMPPLGTPEHLAQWQAAERELAEADPEFMRAGTRLDTKLREIMGSQDGNIYRQHPRGIVAAYHRARMELLEADLKSEQTKSSKLQQELQRLTGLTSIDGGAPGQVGNGSRIESTQDFARLSTKDMRKHLMGVAKRGSTPWF